jgi:hypothetical protein
VHPYAVMQQHVRNCVLYDRETSYRSLPTILRIAVQCPVLTVLHEHWTNNQPRKEADGNLHPIPSSSSQTRTLNLLHPLIIITHLTPPHLHTSTKQNKRLSYTMQPIAVNIIIRLHNPHRGVLCDGVESMTSNREAVEAHI